MREWLMDAAAQLRTDAITLEISFFCFCTEISFMRGLFGKKKYFWVMPALFFLYFLAIDVVLLVFLNNKYGQLSWFHWVRPVAAYSFSISIAVAISVLWKESIPKFFASVIIAEPLGACLWMAIFNLPFPTGVCLLMGGIVTAVLVKLTWPLLIKYRTYKLRHPVIWMEIYFVIVINGFCSYYYYENAGTLTDNLFLSVRLYRIVFLISILVSALYYIVTNLQIKKQLLAEQERLEKYLDKVQNELGEVRDFKQMADRQMTDVDALLQDADLLRDKKTAFKKEALRQYLAELKTRYDALGQIFFCDDYMVDGVLTDFVLSCRKRNIETDILFQNYHPGKIRQGDILGVLFRLMDLGKNYEGVKKICLHAGIVRNQLIFSMEALPEAVSAERKQPGFLQRKKWELSFRKYLKKYYGSIHISENEMRRQLVVGMETD